MDKVIDSVSNAIEKIYQSFILRDLLGFVLPGAISLLSFSFLVIPHSGDNFPGWLVVRLNIQRLTTVQVILFFGFSYLASWILQSLHYGIVDWIHMVILVIRERRNWERLLWIISGPIIFMRMINRSITFPNIVESPTLITRGALSPDLALQRIPGREIPPRVRDSLSYFERASALMLMTGNLALAGIIFLFALGQGEFGWKAAWGIPVILFLYLEHRRLWYARNLRMEVYTSNLPTQQIER